MKMDDDWGYPHFSYTILVSIIEEMFLSTFVFRCFPFSDSETVEVKPPTQQSSWLTSGCAACWVGVKSCWCGVCWFALQNEWNMLKLSNVWKLSRTLWRIWETTYRSIRHRSCQSLLADDSQRRPKCCVGESKNTMKGQTQHDALETPWYDKIMRSFPCCSWWIVRFCRLVAW